MSDSFLKSIVPLIGGALGGPLGTIAATFVADKLGLDSKDVKAVSDVLTGGSMTPDQLTQLRLAEIDFKKFLESNNIKLEEIAALDRSSAREMLKSTRSHVPAALTYLVTFGFFTVLGFIFVYPELKESGPVMMMLGQLSSVWAACVAFWMGTTSGSKDKTDILANSTPAK